MTAKHLLIVYYTGTGNTERMAQAIAKGTKASGVAVEVKRVEERVLDDLVEADGIIVGSPTYFSNVAWQVKNLIDESIALYRKGRALRDIIGGCFTSSGTRRDGEDCIKLLELAFGFHHRMKMVPGIIRAPSVRDEEVSEMCRQYGTEIARQVLL